MNYKQREQEDRNKVLQSLQENPYFFSPEQARIIEAYVYQENHAYWGDYLNYWDELADVVKAVLDLEKRKHDSK